jgi:amino acid transporter
MAKETKLAAGALGTAESILMGVSGTAPGFSAAATTAALVAAVGIHAPSSALYCGLIMFGVTFSFMYLNRISASAGASYVWISEIFGRKLGFFAGWSLLVASALFMVSGTIPVATCTLELIDPALITNIFWVTVVASAWLTFVALVVLKGIKPTSYLQVILTVLEIGILIIIIIAAFITFIRQPEHTLTLASFSPFSFSLELFAKGAIISLFFYWGWDVTLNLSEETKDADSAPGKAALWSMIIVTLIFVAFLMCVLVALTDEEIRQSSTNVLLKLANKILPAPWGNLALISIILSSLGTIETSILQFTRTLFAKSRDGVLHKRWSKVHSEWQTPWTATILIWALGMLFLIIASQEKTVASIIDISINVISFQVAFYYGLCGIACAWHHRSFFLKSFSKTVLLIIWPIISALVLISIDIYGAIYIFDAKSIILGVGGIALGAVPLFLNRRRF